MDRPLPWLKYVDASSLDSSVIDFDGLNVESPTGEHLGDIDGLVVDSKSARPYYVVVDAGGWFKSKHFLLPVGQTRFDADEEVLVTDLTRERIERFPGFDTASFEKLSDNDWQRFNNETCQACTIDGVSVVYAPNEPYSATWDRPEYRHPDWWQAQAAPSSSADNRSYGERARPGGTTGEPAEVDPSPHFDGRAQPGDVLGVETGGERTQIGDTGEDENKRRQDAERAVRQSKS